jgi:hypothetical protein
MNNKPAVKQLNSLNNMLRLSNELAYQATNGLIK